MNPTYAFLTSGILMAFTTESLAFAEESVTTAPKQELESDAPDGEEAGLGLTIDAEVASAYVFRGLNLFREVNDKEIRQLPRFSPSLTWEVFDTGITLMYWGAFQLAGGNTSQNIDAGVGAEQDLGISYDREISQTLTLTGSLISYLYPFADKTAAGATFPAWLEPGAGITYSAQVNLSLKISFMFGLQGVFADSKYLYINPTIGKSIALVDDSIALDLAAGAGMKIFPQGESGRDNRFDLAISAASTLPVWKNVYARPSIVLSWTNRENLGLKYELGFWGGVSVGASF
jgi:hypothetical protein